MDDPFVPQHYYKINVFCLGQYWTSCTCLLQRYGCICHTCFLFAPTELQISVPELVHRRTYRSNFESQWLRQWKSESFGWVSCADRLWSRREIYRQIKRSMDKTLPSGWQQSIKCILQIFSRTFISVRTLKQSRDLLSRRMFPNLLRLLTLQKLGGTYFQNAEGLQKEK